MKSIKADVIFFSQNNTFFPGQLFHLADCVWYASICEQGELNEFLHCIISTAGALVVITFSDAV